METRRITEVQCEAMVSRFLNREMITASMHVGDDGTLQGADLRPETDEREGIISRVVQDRLTIIAYNSRIKLPEGCPNLEKKERPAEYDPVSRTCYLDYWDSWNYAEDEYQPSQYSSAARHEVRHDLVTAVDSTILETTGYRRNRQRTLKPTINPELAYLDEIHSKFFDVIEGEWIDTFKSIDSKTYHVLATGSHLEITKDQVSPRDLAQFLGIIQRLVVASELARATDRFQSITKWVYEAGLAIAVSPNVITAINLMSVRLESVLQELGAEDFEGFANGDKYKQQGNFNYLPSPPFADEMELD